MKLQISIRVAVGIIISIVSFIGITKGGINCTSTFVCVFVTIWNIGEIYAIPHYIRLIERKLTSILKLSIISYLAVGKNALLLVALICYLAFIATFGWINGWIMLVQDIRSL